VARLQTIVNAIREVLKPVESSGAGVYDTQAPPNLSEDSFPLLVFSLRELTPITFMSGAPSDLLGTMLVFHHSLGPKGAGELRKLEDDTYEALHKTRFVVDGWADVQLRCLLRGGIDFIGEGLLGLTDRYEILGRET